MLGRRACIVVVAALVAALTGCGGDDDDDAGGVDADLEDVEATTTTSGDDDSDDSGDDDSDDDDAEPPASVAPLPDVPDPAPALPCDGEAVLCVDPGGAADFATIGDALDAAGSGVVVQIAAGEYDEPVVLDGVEGLSLVGGFPAGGDFSERDPAANETTIRGADDRAVIQVVASSDVRIEGLHLTGGGGYDDGYNVEGGGVFVDNQSSAVAIVANRIDGNAVDHGGDPTATRGGGVSSQGTDVDIIGNVLEGNRAGRGAGISFVGSGVVDSNTVLDNVSVGDHGGGMFLGGELTISRNHVEGNSIGGDLGYGWGGGFIVFGGTTEALLQGNVVTGNTAPSYGSGVFIDESAHATIVGDLYYANECPYEGGAGLFVDSGSEGPTTVVADHLTIVDHDCPDVAQGGNGLYSGASVPDPELRPVVTLTNSILYGNGGLDVLNAGTELSVSYTLTEEADVEGIGNITADPELGDDYTLGDDSPARGAASDGSDLGYTGAPS